MKEKQNTLSRGDVIELEITDLAFGGDGVGRYNDFVCFVNYGVPQDRLKVRVYKKKRSFAYCEIQEIISPSPFRAEPFCRHFNYCGGCSLQHVSYQKQIEFKKNYITDCFHKFAQISNLPCEPVIASNSGLFYRNKMEYTCGIREWTLEPPSENDINRCEFNIGLLYPKFYDRIINITECFLQSEESAEIVKLIREYCRKNNIPAYNQRIHEGLLRFVGLRESKTTGQRLVNLYTGALTNGEADSKLIDGLADALLNSGIQIDVLLHTVSGRKGQVAEGDIHKSYTAQDTIAEIISGIEFLIGPKTFFQINSLQIPVLLDVVKKFADFNGTEKIVDLYCGIGAISLYLSSYFKSCLGLELVEESIIAAKENAKRNNITNCSFIAGDAIESLKSVDFIPDIVITDPPRSGMHPKVVKQLIDMRAPVIVYVSCNPATLARDIEILKEKYSVEAVQPVDMFPQTYHIETVVKLSLK